MGCCISKFTPKNQRPFVQDKLVISQNPPKSTPKITPFIPPPTKISPYFPPSSPTTSNSSISAFFSTNSITSTASSSITSSSSSISSFPSTSSILSSKDRSFSNEFLWSCAKENPHIIRINSIKQASQLLAPPNVHTRKLNSPSKQSIPQKRVRPNSPNRQKSFRNEQDRVDFSYSSRGLKSPSPSRRFSSIGDHGSRRTSPKRAVHSTKVNPANDPVSFGARIENLNAYKRMNSRRYYGNNVVHRINSRIDEVVAVEEVAAQHDVDSVPMEDIDNPLISLDCFIFL